jgi:hypothetical protein
MPGVNISVSGQGGVCIPTKPRDLTGGGLFVEAFVFVSIPGQSDFEGPDRNGKVLDATPGQTLVFVNGVAIDSTDYTLTSIRLSLNEPSQYGNDLVSLIVIREPDSTAFDDLEARVTALENVQ